MTDTNKIGKLGNVYKMPPERLTIIGIDTKDKDTDGHPLWDPRIGYDIDEMLVRNIMVHGVLETVTARKASGTPKGEPDVFEVIDGRQRVRAARVANERLAAEGKDLITVPTMVIRTNKSTILTALLVTMNSCRRDADFVENASYVARLKEQGLSFSEIAVHFGRTDMCIRQWNQINSLDDKVIEAVRKGQIGITAARKWYKLEPAAQIEALNEALAATKDGKKVTKATAADAAADAEAQASAQKEGKAKLARFTVGKLKKLANDDPLWDGLEAIEDVEVNVLARQLFNLALTKDFSVVTHPQVRKMVREITGFTDGTEPKAKKAKKKAKKKIDPAALAEADAKADGATDEPAEA